MIKVERNNTNRSRGLSDKSLPFIAAVKTVLNDLREYWPLTLRQVYYQLVASEKIIDPLTKEQLAPIENSINSYKRLSTMLTKARLQRLIPWAAIEDRTRATLASGGWMDAHHFINDEQENFLDGYKRHLTQTQDIALEVWIEKDALSKVAHRAAVKYCVPVVVAKGFSSISYMHQCKQRITSYARQGQPTVILYFGDFDPSGWEMPEAMLETFHGDMKIPQDHLRIYRCALNEDQVHDMGLPHSPEAIKPKDSRARKFVDRFGMVAVELDAIPPADLEALVGESIEQVLDMDKFEAQQMAEALDGATISELRGEVETMITKWQEAHDID